ncbi:MAG: hypothetical protein COB67_12140 [SAR324 cluster bacterium]|uniref:CvpA family protein n=1 Tax=SAR324 cluster bacterium TaxID=2024889 RepID=A0A2A4ST80_9DELT|nr:MAG: hypothetical protein COB67_12140 [SAR324 cluster bacterium]
MNFFDLFFSILLTVFILQGLVLGTLRVLLTTFGILSGFLLAEYGYEQYYDLSLQYLNGVEQAKIVTYLVLFGFGALLGKLFAMIVKTLRPPIPPSPFSRVIALFLGLLKGGCICLLIFFIVKGYIPSFVDDLDASFFTPWFQTIRELISGTKFA